jgi:hypothetical protein
MTNDTGKPVEVKLLEDGTLEMIFSGEKYTGTWKYDQKRRSYPFTCDWTDGEYTRGYQMSFIKDHESYKIVVHWYLTDMYSPIYFTLSVKNAAPDSQSSPELSMQATI